MFPGTGFGSWWGADCDFLHVQSSEQGVVYHLSCLCSGDFMVRLRLIRHFKPIRSLQGRVGGRKSGSAVPFDLLC